MVSKQEIISQIHTEALRLLKKDLSEEQIREIIINAIRDKIPDEVYLEIMKKYGASSVMGLGLIHHAALFENDYLIQLTLKMIGLMEVSEDWKEFEELTNKKPKPKEITDFDKILKGIMQVPKPKEEKPSK